MIYNYELSVKSPMVKRRVKELPFDRIDQMKHVMVQKFVMSNIYETKLVTNHPVYRKRF